MMEEPRDPQPRADVTGTIAARAVRGSLYNTAGTAITSVLGFVRAVLMARLLLPEHFGIVALALFFNGLAHQLRALGIEDALVQREDAPERVLATFFTMRIGLVLMVTALLLVTAPFVGAFYPQIPILAAVIAAYAGVGVLRGFNGIQETLLSRRMMFAPLVRANIAGSATMTAIAPLLAWFGWGVWSLVAEQYLGQIGRAVILWGSHRQWWPRVGWDAEAARGLFRFGLRVWISNNLDFVLYRFDTFWTGTFLGKTALGFYSQASEFAGYSRRLLGGPLLSVFFPTFARLQNDRLRLSQAFFRSTMLVVRIVVVIVLAMIVCGHDAIVLLLGSRWLPMLPAFQLMAVFRGAQIIARGVNDLLLATGHPQLIIRVRVIQCVIFVPGVILLGALWGFTGVALAAAFTMAAGGALLFHQARRFADFSPLRLWGWPAVAAVLATAAVVTLTPSWAQDSPLFELMVKAVLIITAYGATLLVTEHKQIRLGWSMVWTLLNRKAPEGVSID